jgi:hypothetical protein
VAVPQQDLDAWLSWFAEVCIDAADNVASLTASIAEIELAWEAAGPEVDLQ